MKRRILRTDINVLDDLEAIKIIQSAIAARKPLRIAFVNAHLANLAACDRGLAEMLSGFCLLNDGVGVDLASRVLYGKAFPANLNGTDFTPLLLDRLDPGQRLYLLGATQRIVEAAVRVYEKRWPQHRVVGFFHGFFFEQDEGDLASLIHQARPDIILVGMGNPRQERWLARHVPEVCPVGLAVGALFDFQTDAVPRAPAIVRKAKLEWVFRLMVEPRRLWRRYLVGNALFSLRVAVQWVRGERG